VKNSISKRAGHKCDTEKAAAALEEMNRYCAAHSSGPAAVRKPQLFIRGNNFVVLLTQSVADGIVGFGSTVTSALRAFDQQYRKTLAPSFDSEITS
jgi:hypothetical protein